MRLLVCGSREWPGTWEDIARHFPEDDEILRMSDGLTIMHGACSRVRRGVQVSVDMLADFAARGLGVPVLLFPADWKRHGDSAGPIRNERMLADGRPTHGLAFGPLWRPDAKPDALYRSLIGEDPKWRATGTGGMVRLMIEAGLPVRWVATPEAEVVDLHSMPGPPQ